MVVNTEVFSSFSLPPLQTMEGTLPQLASFQQEPTSPLFQTALKMTSQQRSSAWALSAKKPWIYYSLSYLITLNSPTLLLELQPSTTEPTRHKIDKITGLRNNETNDKNVLQFGDLLQDEWLTVWMCAILTVFIFLFLSEKTKTIYFDFWKLQFWMKSWIA